MGFRVQSSLESSRNMFFQGEATPQSNPEPEFGVVGRTPLFFVGNEGIRALYLYIYIYIYIYTL